MEVRVLTGDLLDQKVDAIVNTWNRNVIPWWLLLPHGVAGAIKRRGGTAPFRELGRYGPIPLGDAVLTGAGKLPFKGIIHVAGIDLFWRSSERAVRNPVRSAMAIAEQQDFSSMAFPIIGAGVGGTKGSAALDVMKSELGGMDSKIDVAIVRFMKPET